MHSVLTVLIGVLLLFLFAIVGFLTVVLVIFLAIAGIIRGIIAFFRNE